MISLVDNHDVVSCFRGDAGMNRTGEAGSYNQNLFRKSVHVGSGARCAISVAFASIELCDGVSNQGKNRFVRVT
jgi:hypothetical protein